MAAEVPPIVMRPRLQGWARRTTFGECKTKGLTMIGLLKRSALVLAFPAMVCLPGLAEAQSSVDPYLPSTTKPPGPQNPGPVNPGDPINQGNMRGSTTGVISPPPMDNQMPVIHPTMPSRMPVIPPAGTPGGNPSVVPK